jgi:hypothetical protein
MAEQPTSGTRVTDVPVVAFEELLRSVPRLVERTLHQAELARTLASHLPCVGSLLGTRRAPESPGAVVPEQLGVLDLFDEPSEGDTDEVDETVETEPPAPTAPAAAAAEPTPASNGSTVPLVEADLAVTDYDSLAASQVVPRLAMLSPEDLRDVLAYEQSHRHRQTILNRVAQLLEA